MRAMHKDEQTGGASRPGNALLTVLAANLALGIGFFFYLLVLPSDPENALVGRYSQDRVLLLAGILAAIIALAALVLTLSVKRPWRQSLGETVLGKNGIVRRILPFSPLLLASLFLVPLLFLPAQLEGLTTYHYSRLAPYLLWPLAFAGALGVGYWLLWAPPQLHLGPKAAEGIAMVFLFLLSFAARAPLSGYGLPYQSVWDEVTTYPRAMELLSGKTLLEGDTVPTYGRASYGDPVIYLTAAGQAAGLLNLLRSGQVFSVNRFVSPADGVGSVLEAVHDSGAPLQYPRLLFALINSFAPVLIYLALRRYLKADLWASIAGGLIYAILSPDVIAYSAFLWPDALATTLVIAAVLAGLELIRSGTDEWIPALACGALVGVAVSISIRYVSLVPIPFIALALARDHTKWARKLGLTILGMGLAFAITSPTFMFNLPTYLARMTGLSWEGDGSLPNRIVSLGFYLRGAFLGQGLGLIVLGLALVGYAVTLRRQPRIALFLTLIVAFHLLVMTSTVYRVARHALALYPLAAVFAALGLEYAQEHLPAPIARLWSRAPLQTGTRGSSSALAPGAAGFLVFLGFLAITLPRIVQSGNFVATMISFKPSQTRMSEYIRVNLPRDVKVGLLEFVPFTSADRRRSRADIVEVTLGVTEEELRDKGIEYVIGTARIGAEFGDAEDTLWDSLDDRAPVAEFGQAGLDSRGRPVADIYLYLARVPSSGTEIAAQEP